MLEPCLDFIKDKLLQGLTITWASTLVEGYLHRLEQASRGMPSGGLPMPGRHAAFVDASLMKPPRQLSAHCPLCESSGAPASNALSSTHFQAVLQAGSLIRELMNIWERQIVGGQATLRSLFFLDVSAVSWQVLL